MDADGYSGVEAAERTKLFAAETLIYDAHHSAITAGQTIVRETDWDDCDHFLSFVHAEVNGEQRVLEMDGTRLRQGPLDRGGTSSGDLLEVSFRCSRTSQLAHECVS